MRLWLPFGSKTLVVGLRASTNSEAVVTTKRTLTTDASLGPSAPRGTERTLTIDAQVVTDPAQMQDMLIGFWSKTFGSTHAFDPEEAREYLSKYGIQFKLPNVDPFLNVVLNACWRFSRTRLQGLSSWLLRLSVPLSRLFVFR